MSELQKAYKKCMKLRWKKRKTVPYKELDIVLSAVEKYMDIVKVVNDE